MNFIKNIFIFILRVLGAITDNPYYREGDYIQFRVAQTVYTCGTILERVELKEYGLIHWLFNERTYKVDLDSNWSFGIKEHDIRYVEENEIFGSVKRQRM